MNKETQLLNAIIQNKDIRSVITLPEADAFFEDYEDVWSNIKEHHYKYREVPSLSTVKGWASDFEYVEITEPTPYYVDEVRAERVKEGLVKVAKGISQGLDNHASSLELLDTFQAIMAGLNKYGNGSKDLNLTDVEKAVKHYEDMAERIAASGGALGIKTGFDAIDSVYETGMAPGHFICCIGWPGHKKSYFTEVIAINAWKQGYKPMIISLEMTPENMRDRVYTLMGDGEFNSSDFTRGEIDIKKFSEWSGDNLDGKTDFIVISNEGSHEITPNVIQGKIDQYKPDLLVVDYLQLLADNAKSKGESERIRNVSKQLKMLAMANNIPVLAVISATSQEKKDRTVPPTLDQAAWSKSIEYDADFAFAVHTYKNEDEDGTKTALTEIVHRKNRYGGEFDFFIDLNPVDGKLVEFFETPGWLED